MDRKLPVERLALGMFVSRLDRPWLDTPFLLQGFLIETEEQLELLRRCCRYVYVDPLRSTNPPDPDAALPDVAVRPAWLAQDIDAPDWTLVDYEEPLPVEEELPRAKALMEDADRVVEDLFQRLARGSGVDPGETTEIMGAMVESVVRNPDALTALARLRRKSEYLYAHALGVSVHALAFGRHLGFDRPELMQLGLGGLLMDVGMARIPGELLAKRGPLTQAEYAAVRRHVKYGLELVGARFGLAGMALQMVEGHHEREDGSGYPARLRAPHIPVPARMAAILDCFDALTRARPHAPAETPYAALQRLYEWSRRSLNLPLVEEFVQCLGAYPVGTLVELSSGEVALVIGHNRARRLKPRLLLLLDEAKRPLSQPAPLDLLQDPVCRDGTPYVIVRALEDGMYGIRVRDYYL